MKHASLAFLAGTMLLACSPSAPNPDTAPGSAMAPTPGPGGEAPVAPPTTPAVDPANPSTDACGATQYAAFVGKPITEPGVPPESPNVRYIRPGTQVTMDFRADRLNIDIDNANIITAFRCT